MKTNLLQEANFDHRIQPETESVIKMIMDTPFVVRYSKILLKNQLRQELKEWPSRMARIFKQFSWLFLSCIFDLSYLSLLAYLK